jgi:oligopeptide transport system permease protein
MGRKISEKEKLEGELEISKQANPFSMMLNIHDAAPATEEEKASRIKMRESTTYWQDAKVRFMKNQMALFSLGIIAALAIFAFVGPFLSPYKYDQQIRGSERLSPCLAHPFGTDNLGRDLLVRNMIGTRISLAIGVFCSIIVLVLGTLVGASAGYIGGWVDNLVMRGCEIIYSVPDILIIIILQISLKNFLDNTFPNMALGSAMFSIFIAFAMLYWVNMARMVRGQVLSLKEREYVLAAKAQGASGGWIVRKHLLPNAVGTIIVTAMFQIPSAIFTESFLSFMGLGASAPMASLGSLANSALSGLSSYPHWMFFPAMLIALIIFAFNNFGDGLRDALDPRLKE